MNWTFRSLLGRPALVCAECAPEEGESAVEKHGIDAALKRVGRRISSDDYDKIVTFAQYEIEDNGCFSLSTWRRVLVDNSAADVSDQQWARSLLGHGGHIERANAWTHIAGAALYLIYICVRPLTPQGETESLSGKLAYFALSSYVATFMISAAYHVYSANYVMSAIFRLADYAGIYLSISAGMLSDLSLVSRSLSLASWQAIADVWIAMAILVAFFVYRRALLPIHKTRRPYMAQKCGLGLARSTNVDLEHSGFRAAAGLTMSLGWVLLIPGAFSALELDCAWFFAGSRFAGTGLLILGMFWDNVLLYPDSYRFDKSAPPGFLTCTRGCGCIFTSHAIWHLVATAAIVATTVGSEYVLAHSARL